jgi:hypothetical protein
MLEVVGKVGSDSIRSLHGVLEDVGEGFLVGAVL